MNTSGKSSVAKLRCNGSSISLMRYVLGSSRLFVKTTLCSTKRQLCQCCLNDIPILVRRKRKDAWYCACASIWEGRCTCFKTENIARTPPEPKKKGGRVSPFLRMSTMWCPPSLGVCFLMALKWESGLGCSAYCPASDLQVKESSKSFKNLLPLSNHDMQPLTSLQEYAQSA